MFWVGLGIVVMGVGVVAMLLSFRWDSLFPIGVTLLMAPILLAVFGIGLGFMSGRLTLGPTYIEGQCYRAVRTSTTALIPVGKVLIPTATRGISMEPIVCP